ncbi:hypothetical protein ACXYMX_16760 [Sporosarcina sp. CAU 1771]
MRRKINLSIGSEVNPVTDVWIQYLIQRIIVEQLEVPYRLQAKLLHQNYLMKRKFREIGVNPDEM